MTFDDTGLWEDGVNLMPYLADWEITREYGGFHRISASLWGVPRDEYVGRPGTAIYVSPWEILIPDTKLINIAPLCLELHVEAVLSPNALRQDADNMHFPVEYRIHFVVPFIDGSPSAESFRPSPAASLPPAATPVQEPIAALSYLPSTGIDIGDFDELLEDDIWP